MNKGGQLKESKFIGKGRMADVYAWGEGKILKLNQKKYPVSLAEREMLITQTAQAAGIPVPTAFEVIEYQGRYGIVFERIIGRSLMEELQARPWKLISVARQMAEMHALIHSKSITAEIPSQKSLIIDGIENAIDITEEEKKTVLTFTQHLPDGDRLCHGDFHPGNILLSSHGPVIIDWMTGTCGNPLADVGRTVMILETGNLPPEIPIFSRSLMTLSRSLLNSIYQQRYFQLRADKKDHLGPWRLPLLIARLREVEEYPQEKQVLLTEIRLLLNE